MSTIITIKNKKRVGAKTAIKEVLNDQRVKKNQTVSIRVPIKLLSDFDGKLKNSISGTASKKIKTQERILSFVSLLCEKGYDHWLEGKHPRIAIKCGTLQQLLGMKYLVIIELLEQQGIVVVNHSYQAGQFCKHFWLSEEYYVAGMVEYEIKEHYMRNRYVKMLEMRV